MMRTSPAIKFSQALSISLQTVSSNCGHTVSSVNPRPAPLKLVSRESILIRARAATGAAKKLLQRDGTANEAQLFVYAAAADVPVAALALINIDSRETSFSGAGRGFTDETVWPQLLATICDEIEAACENLKAGDVRIIANQGATSARRLNLLSRYTELRHGD